MNVFQVLCELYLSRLEQKYIIFYPTLKCQMNSVPIKQINLLFTHLVIYFLIKRFQNIESQILTYLLDCCPKATETNDHGSSKPISSGVLWQQTGEPAGITSLPEVISICLLFREQAVTCFVTYHNILSFISM